MKLKGTITKINSELGYGFVTVMKMDEIFFSEETTFKNAEFNSLKVGQLVTITAIETPRGLFASNFNLADSGMSPRA